MHRLCRRYLTHSMKILIAILLGLFTLNGYSQNEIVVAKFCPLALLDFNGLTIQGGVELKLSNKISWYNEFGIKIGRGISELNVDTNIVASEGYKAKTEIRYYFKANKNTRFEGDYFAANIFFIKDIHNRGITYYQASDSSSRIDNFGVKKNVFGMNIIYGHQETIFKNFLFDFYIGLGVRLRNISTVGEEYNKNIDVIQNPTDPKVWAIGEKADANGGFSVLPNLTCGIRLCYKL